MFVLLVGQLGKGWSLRAAFFQPCGLSHVLHSMCVSTGVDVQRHNEEKLNAAFRAGSTVLLVFSVNMSGHFQGYARMTSLVTRQRVSIPLAPCTAYCCYV